LYSLGCGLSNEVSRGIPLYLKKKKHIRQNVGKEKHKLACFGEFFYKNRLGMSKL
jgi:hypothetical protein